MEWDNRSFVLTVLVYTILLVIFLFFGFKSYPLPGDQGILIDFGQDETGFGPEEPMPVREEIVQAQSQAQPSDPVEESILSQDFEEAPTVVKKEEEKKKEEKPKDVKPVEVKKPEETKPKVNPNASWSKNRNSQSTSEGVAGGSGNQGKPTGGESDNHSLGAGLGEGIVPNLTGRSGVSLPSPEFNHQKEGKVVVEITVDRSGRVISAVPGVRGSTTLDSYLLAAAKKAALASSFNKKDDAPAYQKGTITYYFRLK